MRTDLVRLLAWLSPAFPTGGFGYSHGLETAIREGRVRDGGGLEAWVGGLVELGSGWTDAVLLAAAWRGETEVAELAEALAPSLERRRETLAQGEAFLTAARAWDIAPFAGQVAYPVAVGAACRDAGIALEDALAGWLHAFCANLVAAAVRAVPLGQSEAVAVTCALEPVVLATAERVAASSLDDLGACGLLSDICAMRHETLDGRLFIS